MNWGNAKNRLPSATAVLLAIAWLRGAWADDMPAAAREKLAELGAATIERLATEPASWTAIHDNALGFSFVKSVVAGADSQITLGEFVDGKAQVQAKITVRGGTWHVVEGDQRVKYRPFEAPLKLPMLYFCLSRSGLLPALAETLRDARFDGESKGIAFFRVDAEGPMREQAQAMVDRIRSLEASNPNTVSERVRDQAASLDDTLKNGERIGVDKRTGIIVQSGIFGRRIRINSFRWIDAAPDSQFAIDGVEWRDETTALANDASELAMFGHCGAWRPGMPTPETDAVLVNLRTGR